MPASAFRIIGGQWRSRRLNFSDRPGLRPTPDRVRETLFNWLQGEVSGAAVLDCFAGSGALAFEAASRGAARVVMLESDRIAAGDLQTAIRKLQAEQLCLQQIDALRWLQREASERFDLVFLDPPYRSDLLAQAAQRLEQQHWLANHAKLYIEVGAGDSDDLAQRLPHNWRLLKMKTAGQVNYSLWQRSESACR